MSPVLADMMRRTLLKKARDTKDFRGLEHISRRRDDSQESKAHNDDNELDFASCGQARLLEPTLHLLKADPAAFKALVHWLCHSDDSVTSDLELQKLLRFTSNPEKPCICSTICIRLSGVLSPANYCEGHDPTVAINLIRLGKELQMTKLCHVITKALLMACGFDKFLEKQVEEPKFPHSITFQRYIADKTSFRNALQHCRFTITAASAHKGLSEVSELTGAEYEMSAVREGELEEEVASSCMRWVSILGSFEVSFDFWPDDVPHVSQSSFTSKLKRMVLG